MSNVILKAKNISKQYRLGLVGSGSLRDDFTRFWAKTRGREDPFLKVGEVNDRSQKSTEDYVWALKNIDFEVERGEVLGIIGKNGAGKSTLLKILSRVTAPTTGVIKSRGRIASLLEVGTGFHHELTGRENIYLNGAILGMSRAEINGKIDEIVDFSGCERYIDTPTKRYSSGMTVRLAFAVAAHLEPEILVVDEVLAVGDAEFQKKAIGKMQDISSQQGRTVLFVSHNMASVQNLCTRAISLKNGSINFEGKVDEVVNEYLSLTNFKRNKRNLIGEEHRRESLGKEIELLALEIQSIFFYSNNPITFKIDIMISEDLPIDLPLSITGSICTYADERVGSFFIETKRSEINRPSFELVLNDHNLAIGHYYLNVAICSGSMIAGNLKTLDHAYNAIGFEVIGKNDDGKTMTEWNSQWGRIHFPSTLRIIG